MTAEAFPLAWPAGWPRTPAVRRQRARFGKGYRSGAEGSKAQSLLFEELRRLGARQIVLSTNVELRRDGLPYANRSQPQDPGVAIYFTLGTRQRCFPCDRWDRVADNMYAIGLSIAALRGLERWGAKTMVDAAFDGFRALPERGSGEAWYDVLRIPPTASVEEIRAAYKARAAATHPDVGGDEVEFRKVTAALREALASRGSS